MQVEVTAERRMVFVAARNEQQVLAIMVRCGQVTREPRDAAAPSMQDMQHDRLVTREAGRAWRVALIQKDPRRAAQGRVSLAGLPIANVRSVRLETWHAPDVFDATDDHALWQHAQQALPVAASITVQLPPSSLALLTITLSS